MSQLTRFLDEIDRRRGFAPSPPEAPEPPSPEPPSPEPETSPMMVLIDQDGGDAPFVEVTVRLNASDLARLGEAERRALYSDDTQTVLDQLAPAHRFLSREGSL